MDNIILSSSPCTLSFCERRWAKSSRTVRRSELAKRIHVSFPRVNEIINGRRGVTPDTALRLSKLLGTTPEFWLNGQRNWDLWQAIHSDEAKDISTIQTLAS